MSVFRYYLGNIYVVVHPKKGFWNSAKKKCVGDMRKATYYKNEKCASVAAKKLGRSARYCSLRVECPDYLW